MIVDLIFYNNAGLCYGSFGVIPEPDFVSMFSSIINDALNLFSKDVGGYYFKQFLLNDSLVNVYNDNNRVYAQLSNGLLALINSYDNVNFIAFFKPEYYDLLTTVKSSLIDFLLINDLEFDFNQVINLESVDDVRDFVVFNDLPIRALGVVNESIDYFYELLFNDYHLTYKSFLKATSNELVYSTKISRLIIDFINSLPVNSWDYYESLFNVINNNLLINDYKKLELFLKFLLNHNGNIDDSFFFFNNYA